MSLSDKISSKAEELTGKAKEATGAAIGDEQLETEGKVDQVVAGAKHALAEVKDTAGKLVDKVKDTLSNN